MNLALWIIVGLLAAVFLASGAMKLIRTKQQLVASGMAVLDDFSPGAIKGIGALEILAAVGLTLPAALDIAPVLVPLAAVGVALLMTGATAVCLRRNETRAIAVNLALLALAVLVAWGRFGPQSFTG
jgi:DoxX-like family